MAGTKPWTVISLYILLLIYYVPVNVNKLYDLSLNLITNYIEGPWKEIIKKKKKPNVLTLRNARHISSRTQSGTRLVSAPTPSAKLSRFLLKHPGGGDEGRWKHRCTRKGCLKWVAWSPGCTQRWRDHDTWLLVSLREGAIKERAYMYGQERARHWRIDGRLRNAYYRWGPRENLVFSLSLALYGIHIHILYTIMPRCNICISVYTHWL